LMLAPTSSASCRRLSFQRRQIDVAHPEMFLPRDGGPPIGGEGRVRSPRLPGGLCGHNSRHGDATP
jgi:hypothetical protein